MANFGIGLDECRRNAVKTEQTARRARTDDERAESFH